MSIQYIGARYVIKIYENKTNRLSAQWDERTAYEPLTMVTDDYNSYLSKKFVSSTVGKPAENPEYWVQTGYYSGQMVELQNRVTELENALNQFKNITDTRINSVVTELAATKDEFRAANSNLRAALNDEANTRQTNDANLATNIATVSSNLTQEIANRMSGDTLLQQQIDNIVAPSGTAPSEAEILNARIGADGVTYSSLGEAIRTQVGALNSIDDAILNPFNGFQPVLFSGLTYSKGSVSNPQTVNYSSPVYCANDLSAFNAQSAGSDTDGFLSYKIDDNITIPVTTGKYEALIAIKTNKNINNASFRLSSNYVWGSAFHSLTDFTQKNLKAGNNFIKCTFDRAVAGSDSATKYKYLCVEFDNRYSDLDFEVYLIMGTAIYDALDNVKNDIYELHKKRIDYTTKYIKGGYIPLNQGVGNAVNINNFVGNTQFAYIVLKCKRGDKFIVSGASGSSPRAWAFLDENYILKSVAGEAATVSNLELVAEYDGYFVSDLDFQQIPHTLIYEYIETANDNINEYDADILFWGDSITYGAGGNGINFPTVCSTILGASHLNLGVGGETANMVAARQGGNSIHIPVGENVTSMAYTDMLDDFGMFLTPLLQGNGNHSGDNIIINDEVYSIENNQATISPTLSYDIDGYTELTSDFPLVGHFRGSLFKGKLNVILVGYNGAYVNGVNDIDSRIAIIDSMIKHIGNNDYIIMGLSTGNSSNDDDDLKLLAKYGDRFFDTRKMLVNYGLATAEVTPTTQDTTDISNGVTPTSLRADSTHLNSLGYTVVGKMLANKIASLGYKF